MLPFQFRSVPEPGIPVSWAFVRTCGLLACVGLVLVLVGAGPVSAQACTSGGDVLLCLEVENDLALVRDGEVAYSGVAVAQAAGLLNTDSLFVENLAGQPIPAQFRVLSRWGGVVDNASLPIRWLEVAIQDSFASQTTQEYRLRVAAGTPPAVPDPLTVAAGATYVVDTNAATVTIDPTNPALLDRLQVGAQTAYQHTAGAGPRLELPGAVVLDTAQAGEVVIDAGSFEVLEQGPLKASFAVRGHFVDAGGATLCDDFTGNVPAYQAMGFTAVMTLTRNSSDVDLQVNLRNECLDAQFGPFTDGLRTIERFSWELPTSVATSNRYYSRSGAVATAAGDVVVEQRKGAGNPWLRRARVLVNGAQAQVGETADSPLAGVGSSAMVVTGQISFMRFREPQAVATVGSTLSLRFISESLDVGGGKGLWNTARVGFLTGINQASELDAPGQRGQAFLERGLLVRSTLADVNAAGVFPSMGTDATSLFKSEYESFMNTWHDGTVGAGGQHEQARTFGSQLWPDIQGSSWNPAPAGPSDNSGALNYWNASRAELLEFFRTGDPKWVWELSLPLTWQQVVSAYVNLGENEGFKNGLNLTSPICDDNSGVCAEGLWYRYPGGSDDYGYTWGNLGYVVRPTYFLQRRFAAAGATVVGRYNVPQAQQGDRQLFVNRVDPQRQVIQHFVQLANCAEFVPGAEGQACHDRLVEVVTEMSQENMSSGLICQGDIQPADPSLCMPNGGNPALDWCDCVQPQQFIANSLIHPFFVRVLRNYGDLGGNISNALAMSSWHLYRAGIDIPAAQAPSVPSDPQRPAIPYTNADWLSQPGWDLDVSPYAIQDVDVVDNDPNTTDPSGDPANLVLDPNFPQTAAQFLLAHSLNPALDLCTVGRAPFQDQFLLDAWDEYENFGGWGKGPAQVMQSVVFGIGAYDTCAQGGNSAPVVEITAPANGSNFGSGAQVTLTGTASDTEDGDLGAQLSWTSNLDGALGTGLSVQASLSDGTHTVTASVTDSGSLAGQAQITVTVGGAGNQTPQVTITSPANGSDFGSGVTVNLVATATDTEDGDLSAQVVWTSDVDGALGTGASINTTLSDGTHVITAAATDSGTATGTDMVTVDVGDSTCGITGSGFALDENFDADASGWTMTGLWHRVTNTPCATPGFASASSSIYYGQDQGCDYDTGAQTIGSLTSPTVANIQADSELSFSFYRQVEDEPSATVDRTEVFVRPLGGQWSSLWMRDSQTSSAAAWLSSGAISLAAFAGQDVEVRFEFDSDDEQFNDFVGWLIDDVRVSGCQPGLVQDRFESGDLSVWSLVRD